MRYKHKSITRGFSLVELLVTLAISILVVSAVLIRFESFDSIVVLKSIAYEIALTVREAQVFAVSVTGDSSGSFSTPYGVQFDMSNPQQYVFFADDGTTALQFDNSDTIVETYTMNNKYTLVDLCVDSTCSKNSASVVFQRPEFDPHISSNPAQANPTSVTAQIGLTDDPTTTFSVVIGLTGQVTVTSP